MKIRLSELKRIIVDEIAATYGGHLHREAAETERRRTAAYDSMESDAHGDADYEAYAAWVRRKGHVTTHASSVLKQYGSEMDVPQHILDDLAQKMKLGSEWRMHESREGRTHSDFNFAQLERNLTATLDDAEVMEDDDDAYESVRDAVHELHAAGYTDDEIVDVDIRAIDFV